MSVLYFGWLEEASLTSSGKPGDTCYHMQKLKWRLFIPSIKIFLPISCQESKGTFITRMLSNLFGVCKKNCQKLFNVEAIAPCLRTKDSDQKSEDNDSDLSWSFTFKERCPISNVTPRINYRKSSPGPLLQATITCNYRLI